MLQARPIFDGDDGERFFAALRRAAERFPHPASYVNATEFAMGIQERLRSGAEPMWAYYENEFDRILFRLRIVGGHAWIDYVGVFDAAPTAPVHVQGKGVPPSMSPPALRPDGSVTPTLRQGAARPQPRRPPPG
jgi:hypothetical protein